MGLGEPGKSTRFVFQRFLPTPQNYKS